MSVYRTRQLLILFVSLTLGLLICTSACNKKSEQTSSSAAGSTSQSSSINLAKSLASLAPIDSFGLIQWDTTQQSYQKLSQSPWGRTVGEITGLGTSTQNNISQSLKEAGLDINDKKTFEDIFSQGVVFLSPSTAGEPQFGIIFKSSETFDLKSKIITLKQELTKAGQPIEELKLKNGEGFSYSLKELSNTVQKNNSKKNLQQATQPEIHPNSTLYLGWKDKLACIANSGSVVDQVLSADGKSLPSFVSTSQFSKATSGFPTDQNRFLTGYFDVKALLATTFVKKDLASSFNPENFPIKEIAFAGAMDKAPYYNARLTYNPADDTQAKWFKAINSSPTENISSTISSNPLLFLSYDGQTIKQIKDILLTTFIPENDKNLADIFTKRTAFLDQVVRLGAMLRSAPLGASMLPIPDLMLIIESKDSESTKLQLLDLINSLSQDTKIPPIEWHDKKVGTLEVKYMLTPMGLGIFLTTYKNFVIVSSTEEQINSLNTLDPNKTFARNLNSPADSILGKQPTVGNIFVSMEEVGSLIENMGGMLSMYAPQNDEIKKLMAKENIESIKKMGTLVSSITAEDGVIDLKSFYQAGSVETQPKG